MPQRAQIFRILIASPADLSEEREVVAHAINHWNDLHAVDEAMVLLPVRWETHGTPESGSRPQAAINRQLVESCDALIGMFWTKLGTSTGVAFSGTVEEIDHFVAAGKPALLYFSTRPIDPSKMNLAEQRKLRAFKAATQKQAVTATFANPNELRAKVLTHLTREARKLKSRYPVRVDRLERVVKTTELMTLHKKEKITPEA